MILQMGFSLHTSQKLMSSLYDIGTHENCVIINFDEYVNYFALFAFKF